MSVNGTVLYTSGIEREGHVGVHTVASADPTFQMQVRSEAYETVSPAGFIFARWPAHDLADGDIVSIRCIAGAQPSEPAERRSSRNDQRVQIRDQAIARELVSQVDAFIQGLESFIPRVSESHDPEELRLFKLAVGHVMSELGERLLGPTYNAHPELRPGGLRGVPL